MRHAAKLTAAVAAAILSLVVAGCQRSAGDEDGASTSEAPAPMPGQSAQSDEELDRPLAKVGDVVITVREFQERINRQTPYVRARYTSMAKKKEFLENMVRFEVLAKEARNRGFDRHPDVVRTMKNVMIQKLMKELFENSIKPEDITEDEMLAFYREHEGEYSKPEEARASVIVLRTRKEADRVAKLALGEPGKTNKGFRELVTKYSRDEATKLRGGDLRYFSRTTKEVPAAVVTAVFAIQNVGDVAGPVAVGNRFYIIKKTGQRKAVTKQFEDVKRQIQNRIYRKRRSEAQQKFITDLKSKSKIEVYDQNLRKIRVDTSAQNGPSGAAAGGELPAMPPEPVEPSPGEPAPIQ